MNKATARTTAFGIAVVLFVQLDCSVQARVLRGDGRTGDRCTMAGNVTGLCQEITSCLTSGGVLQREGDVLMCGLDFGRIHVCCRHPEKIAKELCDYWKPYWRTDEGSCVIDHTLIVGGENAILGEFPHLVSVSKVVNNAEVNHCGGTLVTPHFVLTAAHCVLGLATKYFVRLGEHDLNVVNEHNLTRLQGPIHQGIFGFSDLQADMRKVAPAEQAIDVAEIIVHPLYKRGAYYYDIALLRLKEPAVMTERVLPACLPSNPNEDLLGERVTVAGWGSAFFAAFEQQTTLQKVKVPVVENLRCWEAFSEVNQLTEIPDGITSDMICAGEDNKDSCGGDSGGPLFKPVEDNGAECEQTVFGIVSFGRGCGRLGIYTRVSSYLDWITGYVAPELVPLI